MSEFTELQPREGETVLHCGHLDEPKFHFFAFDGVGRVAVPFMRPDGTKGLATFMALCDSCFEKNATQPERCIRGDAKWKGNVPFVKKDLA